MTMEDLMKSLNDTYQNVANVTTETEVNGDKTESNEEVKEENEDKKDEKPEL